MNQYRKGADEQFWLESFNNGSMTVNRVTKEPLLVDNIFVNVIGTIQDSVLADLAKKHTDNGFLDRFLYTKPFKKISRLNLEDMNPEAIRWWDNYIKHAFFDFEQEITPLIIEFNEEAKIKYLECDNAFCLIEENEDIESGVKGYISKLKTYLPRFCLLFCVMDFYENGTELKIDFSHVEKSFRVCNYFFDTARKIFAEQRQQNEMSDFLNTLKGKSNIDKILAILQHYPNLKQKEVADLVGVTRVYVAKILAVKKKKDDVKK